MDITYGLTMNRERAQHFYSLEEEELEAWLRKIGLGEYSQSVLRHAPSGAELVRVISSQHNADHVSCIYNVVVKIILYVVIKDQASFTSEETTVGYKGGCVPAVYYCTCMVTN